MLNLKTRLEALASTFAAEVLAAIRNSSLEDLLSDGSQPAVKRGPGRPRREPETPAAPTKGGRPAVSTR